MRPDKSTLTPEQIDELLARCLLVFARRGAVIIEERERPAAQPSANQATAKEKPSDERKSE